MKHARASTIRIVVETLGDRLRVEVIDDGIGGADAAGSGLLGLADRLHAIDGDLSVRSERGRGTVVSAVLPLGER
jgi:signal transduction histidine kinase